MVLLLFLPLCVSVAALNVQSETFTGTAKTTMIMVVDFVLDDWSEGRWEEKNKLVLCFFY